MGHDRGVTSIPADLLELAHAYGVATEFHDWRGRRVDVPEETVSTVLAAMDVDVSDPARALAARQDARWARMLPPSVVVVSGEERSFAVHVTDGDPVEVSVDLEAGGRRDLGQVDRWVPPRRVGDRTVGEATFAVPTDLPLGYHRIRARSGAVTDETVLIVTPAWLGLPESVRDRRSWGLATQLYSVRSRQSWGVGDLVDLTDLAVWSGAELGADYVLVNPLHAAEPVAPLEPSPYLPTSRRFFNPLYVRVERVVEYAALPAAARATVEALAADVHARLDARRRDRPGHRVDREARRPADRARRAAQRRPREGPGRVPGAARRRAERLRHLVRDRAGARQRLPLLAGRPAGRGLPRRGRVRREPTRPRSRSRRGCSGSSTSSSSSPRPRRSAPAWRWAPCTTSRWACTPAARTPGGSGRRTPRASRSAHRRTRSTRSARTGASRRGVPDRLEELGYAPFRDLIAAVLRHAGGVRVDHIIGLFRLWWIPEGRPPSEGTYVRYDHEAMIGVLALEALRAGAVVVGEDLGVVEPSARDYLRSRGILGTSILWFERDEQGEPLAAERWRELCLASVTTHDLPPTAGYLAGDHVRLRDRLGLLERSVEDELAADDEERESWLGELRVAGCCRTARTPRRPWRRCTATSR